jgi:hypothetical protein
MLFAYSLERGEFTMRFFTHTKALRLALSTHPVFAAAELGDVDVLQATIKAYGDKLDQYKQAMSPLHGAYTDKHYDCMLLLLEAGAKPSPRLGFDRQWTLLHTVSYDRDNSAIRLLLLYGANPKLKDTKGLTPLDLTPEHSMTRRYFQETRQLCISMENNKRLAKQAIVNQQPADVARYLSQVATCWQSAADSENHPFLQQFYYHKALETAKQAQQQQPSTEIASLIDTLSTYIQPYDKKSTIYKTLQVFFTDKFLASVHAKGGIERVNQKSYLPSLS